MVAAWPAGSGLCVRNVFVAREQVAWLRYLLEAHEGLAFMHSDGSGQVILLTTDSQRAKLDALVDDLVGEGVVRLA